MEHAHPRQSVTKEISPPRSWAKIREIYPDQWVCLVEIDWLEEGGLEFHTARVVGHGSTSEACFTQARPWWESYASIGSFFTGQMRQTLPRCDWFR